MKLSIVIPAHNEEGCIRSTTENLAMVLEREEINYEILIINDNSHDATEDILHRDAFLGAVCFSLTGERKVGRRPIPHASAKRQTVFVRYIDII